MRRWPALDVQGSPDPELVLAAADEFSPTALDDRHTTVRLFFATKIDRDAACVTLARGYVVEPIEVDDHDWVRRSQQNLEPITVGRITVAPPWAGLESCATTIVIEPSMGFGTGHHATTRLCLAALQTVDLAGAFVLDVGTGSGILAIAAARLGAARALGIDSDPDAIHSARENLVLNVGVGHVVFELADLTSAQLPTADVVTANLTGTLLVRAAAPLTHALRPGGALILGGLLVDERQRVRDAFASLESLWEHREDEWVGLAFSKPGTARSGLM
jgi:ribosomal protein L11 methyltransferase